MDRQFEKLPAVISWVAPSRRLLSDRVIAGLHLPTDSPGRSAIKPFCFLSLLLLSLLTLGCDGTSGLRAHSAGAKVGEPDTPAMFLPPPLADDWTKWVVGEWELAGTGNAGKGRGVTRFELALGGQFLICRGQAELTGLDPDYLKKHMHATDTEIERFRRAGYQQLEIYTIDQKTGEVIGFLFDNLRCVAQGRGRREGYREIMDWEWQTGQKSTRITERVSVDKIMVIERTPNPDGSVMEDKAEMTRMQKNAAPPP